MREYPDKFNIAHAIVEEAEGGLVEHKNDPGGVTKYGISLRFLEDYAKTKAGRKVLNSLQIASVSKKTVVELTKQKSKEIFYNAFWLSPRISELPLILSIVTYDFAVNSGSFYGVKVLQKALKVSVDGVIGEKTLAAANSANIAETAKTMLEERAKFYIRLTQQKPKMKVFLKGWLNRVENLAAYLNKVSKQL